MPSYTSGGMGLSLMQMSPPASFMMEDFKIVNSGVDPMPDNSDYKVISNHIESKHKVRDHAPHLEKPL
jgi:hypothetical protein